MKRPRKTNDERLQQGQKPSQAARNNINADKAKRQRLRARIHEIAQYEYVYFVTFTIADLYYGHDREFYFKPIKKVLHDASEQYIINEDYGTQTERLHFHALIGTTKEIVTEFQNGVNKWKDCPYLFGHVHVVRFNTDEKRGKHKIQEYLLKAENHTIKQKAGVIIYSKRKRSHEKIHQNAL